MLKVGLVGYGKMGHMLKNLSNEFNIEIVAIIDPTNEEANYKEINENSISNCDVLIDFSTPNGVINNIKRAVKQNIPIVVGTTGWLDSLNEITEYVELNNGALIYGSNFSIGVNILFQIVNFSSELFNKIPGYDVAGSEIHHRMKKDIPSGTGKTLAEIVLNNYDTKEEIVYQPGNREIKKEELHFTSLRLGEIPGFHEVVFDSKDDQLSIKHNAKGREGFAKGALMAAKYIYDKKGVIDFVSSFSEIIEEANNEN